MGSEKAMSPGGQRKCQRQIENAGEYDRPAGTGDGTMVEVFEIVGGSEWSGRVDLNPTDKKKGSE